MKAFEVTLEACSQLNTQMHLQPFEQPKWGAVFRGNFCSVALLVQLLVLTESVLIDLGRDLKEFTLLPLHSDRKMVLRTWCFLGVTAKTAFNCSTTWRFPGTWVVACPSGDVYVPSWPGFAWSCSSFRFKPCLLWAGIVQVCCCLCALQQEQTKMIIFLKAFLILFKWLFCVLFLGYCVFF